MTIDNPPISPFDLVSLWLDDAKVSEPNDPDAACLSTVDGDGYPNARVVLVRKIDENGFCFFTNYNSKKGAELQLIHKAALTFHWKSKGRQVRVRGNVEKVSAAESDHYYQSRPLGNRIGAWASRQSEPLDSRQTLIDRITEAEQKFGTAPPRPDHWGGFRLSPLAIEFWQEGSHRLHDRLVYTKEANGTWGTKRLYP